MNPIRLSKKSMSGLRTPLLAALLLVLPGLLAAQLTVTLSGTSPTCNGYTNGAVEADISGGNPPYQITWSNGATNSTSLGLLNA